ncbi:MAG: HAMP domain-containing protein [Deltaproteobacteria bacterium]|nr:HAMP domain-containing protein [Deltaproteobacteria bacterium]
MSLNRKLALFIVAATVLPLVLVGLFVARIAEDALRARILEAQVRTASAEAEAVARFIEDRSAALQRAAAAFDLSAATAPELAGAAQLLYRADDAVAVAALLDATGQALAPPALLAADDQPGDLARHPRATEAAAERLVRLAPRERALAEGAGAVVLSGVYGAPERGDTALALALPVRGPGGTLLVEVAELSLAALSARTARVAGRLVVVDGEGRVLAAADRMQLTQPDPLWSLLGGVPRQATATSIDADAGALLAARAPVPVLGLEWTVQVSLPEREAFAPVRRMRLTLGGAVLGVLALLLAVAALFVRQVRRGLDVVVAGAEAFAGGALAHKIVPPPERELRELATTFNKMGDELLAARGRLERWNEELEATVERRTRELREAQARLLETQKLAAVGQLGAGVAHEINNPLATVLGTAQNLLLKRRKAGARDDEPDMAALLKVERAAKRVRDVTGTLLRFSQRSDTARRAPVTLESIVIDACAMSRAGIIEQGADLQLELETPSPVVQGDAGELVQVVVHLLANARTAVAGKQGGTVRVVGARDGDTAVLRVIDNGKGIDPAIKERIFEPFFTTKDVWSNLGLGLSVSFRIVEEHGGTFTVQSVVGEGTTVEVRLPLARAA